MPIIAFVVFGAAAFAVLNLFMHFFDYRALVYGVGQVVVGAALLWLLGLILGAFDFAALLAKAKSAVDPPPKPQPSPRNAAAPTEAQQLYNHALEIVRDASELRLTLGARWAINGPGANFETRLAILETEAYRLRMWISHRDLFIPDTEIHRLCDAEIQRLSRVFHRVLHYDETKPYENDRRRAIVPVVAACLDLPAPCRIFLFERIFNLPHAAIGFVPISANP